MLGGRCRFPCTFPELDPYRPVRKEVVIAPLGALPPPAPVPRSAKFFAYLAGDVPWVPRVLSGLVKAGLPGAVYVRRPPEALLRSLKRTGLELFDSPPPFAEVLGEVSVLVHHGGLGTAEAALTAGRPQIVIARHLEQGLTARALHELGVGFRLPRKVTPEGVAQAVRRVAGDRGVLDRAMALAQDIDDRGSRDGVATIAEACHALLSRPA